MKQTYWRIVQPNGAASVAAKLHLRYFTHLGKCKHATFGDQTTKEESSEYLPLLAATSRGCSSIVHGLRTEKIESP
jgi:hypothetical protein